MTALSMSASAGTNCELKDATHRRAADLVFFSHYIDIHILTSAALNFLLRDITSNVKQYNINAGLT